MLAVELERTVQFPRLPLAKTVILTGTEGSITGLSAQGEEQKGALRRLSPQPKS
jgi:hypothetical protein